MSEKHFSIAKIFLKDLSFEAPMGVRAFNQQANPAINVDLSSRNHKLDGKHTQVDLRVTVTAKHEEQVVFIAEVEYAGVFVPQGFSDDELKRIQGTTCPTVLFPYIRETLDSTMTKAGFPPMALTPINFEALYQEALDAENAQASSQH